MRQIQTGKLRIQAVFRLRGQGAVRARQVTGNSLYILCADSLVAHLFLEHIAGINGKCAIFFDFGQSGHPDITVFVVYLAAACLALVTVLEPD